MSAPSVFFHPLAAQEWIRHLVEAGQIGEEVEDVRVRRRLGTWQGRVACTRYIRDLEADDLLDITGMLTPQEQTAYTSQPVSPPPHSPVYHIVAVLAIYRCSTMAQTGVSGPVVVDGESFLDALFASAGQG